MAVDSWDAGTTGSKPVVVFDIGGVLIDWNPRYLYRRLLPDEATVERFLAEVCTAEWNTEQDRGRPWAEAVGELSARFPEHSDLIAAYDHRWDETVAGAIEESVAILAELRDQGQRLYALTNFSTDKFARTRSRFPFLSWFEGIVVSAEEGMVKPDPRIYRVLLERYGLPPEETIYIDDVPANAAAADAVGMTGVHFTAPPELRATLVGLGVLPPRR